MPVKLTGVERLAKLERLAIEAALKRTGGNGARAARELGISRGALYYKLKRYATMGEPVAIEAAAVDEEAAPVGPVRRRRASRRKKSVLGRELLEALL
jgi:hypothetical protein